jgi:hypothetical protein
MNAAIGHRDDPAGESVFAWAVARTQAGATP